MTLTDQRSSDIAAAIVDYRDANGPYESLQGVIEAHVGVGPSDSIQPEWLEEEILFDCNTQDPSEEPTGTPTAPTEVPTEQPSEEPTTDPTHDPTLLPSVKPTMTPTELCIVGHTNRIFSRVVDTKRLPIIIKPTWPLARRAALWNRK